MSQPPSMERYVQEMVDFHAEVKKLTEKIPSEFDWKVKEVLISYQSLFDRFCPFAIGNRVELTETPVINGKIAHGWIAHKHFLIKGSKGVITSRDYRAQSQKFTFMVAFDDDSWIDLKGVVQLRPPSEKGQFLFSEDMLALVEK